MLPINRVVNRIASTAWSAINSTRRKLFETGILRPTRLPSRVVSVGNLQAGGSGKTPLVAKIAQEAAKKNLTVFVLLRGVGGEWENGGGLIGPNEPAPSPQEAGDEALLLHWLCPQAWIAVGKNRVDSFYRASEKAGKNPDLVILDDGFQHLQVHRDVDVLCITSRTSQEIPYREFITEAERAAAWVFTKGNSVPFSPEDPRWVKLKRKFPSPVAGKKYWFVSAISNPKAAMEELEKSGFTIERHTFRADHYLWLNSEAQKLEDDAKQAGLTLLMTGKDSVKWPGSRSLIHVVEPEFEITEGSEQWSRTLWG